MVFQKEQRTPQLLSSAASRNLRDPFIGPITSPRFSPSRILPRHPYSSSHLGHFLTKPLNFSLEPLEGSSWRVHHNKSRVQPSTGLSYQLIIGGGLASSAMFRVLADARRGFDLPNLVHLVEMQKQQQTSSLSNVRTSAFNRYRLLQPRHILAFG